MNDSYNDRIGLYSDRNGSYGDQNGNYSDQNGSYCYWNLSYGDRNGSYWNWNSTLDGDWSTSMFTPSPVFELVIYAAYSLIFVMAILGNTFVCLAIASNIRKWTVTNYFIINMAVGDILMALFCIPFTSITTFVMLYWPFGTVMCCVVSFSQAVSVFVSAYTMVAISCDRYLAILYPLRPRMTKRQARIIIAVVWIVAMLTALPLLLVTQLTIPAGSKWHESESRHICSEVWERENYRFVYTNAVFVLQYCLPLGVLIFTYARIAVEIWGKKTPGEAHRNRDLRFARSKRKMIKMMIIVVVVFVFCWLPINIFQIVGEQYECIWNWSKVNYLLFACHWLAMSHSAYNPIIYCCFNSKFRQSFQQMSQRCPCCASVCRTNSRTAQLQRMNTLTTYSGSIRYRAGSAALSRRPVNHNGGPFLHSTPIHNNFRNTVADSPRTRIRSIRSSNDAESCI